MRPSDRDEAPDGAESPAAVVEAVVVESLPSGLYRVEAGGRALTAHAARGGQRDFVRVLVGDRVVVEVTRRDPTRGRIMRKA